MTWVKYFLVAVPLCLVWMISSVVPVQGGRQAAAAQAGSEVYTNVYNGWKWWHVYCYRCHGMNAIGGSLAPNLIDPNAKLPLKQFLIMVRNGSADGAMQPWDKLLDDRQITQLYYYVMARSEKVLPPGRPDEVGPKGGVWVPPKGWPKFK